MSFNERRSADRRKGERRNTAVTRQELDALWEKVRSIETPRAGSDGEGEPDAGGSPSPNDQPDGDVQNVNVAEGERDQSPTTTSSVERRHGRFMKVDRDA